jgi:hypothetical protein
MYESIPDELKSYPQWVVWRYETRINKDGSPAPKPTKVPYCATNARPASTRDYSTWTSYETAVAIAQANSNELAGIGFMLTRNDPFAFIDLDASSDPGAIALQQSIFANFVTYAELSPSGKGLHLIGKGAVVKGVNNRDRGVEIYTQERFMTMTGNVYRDAPIADIHEDLQKLWKYVGGTEIDEGVIVSAEQTRSDDEVCTIASEAENGDKFRALYRGEYLQFYKSHSEADQALINIIAFYTQNVDQIRRIFLASALGQRDKAKRVKYFSDMVRKGFDRMPPLVDLSAIKAQMSAALAALEKTAPLKREEQRATAIVSAYADNPFVDVPPGMVGRIARFIHDSAPRPVPEIALYGAIGLLAGICGRCFNVSGTGLNQYLLLLARTGTGKEAAKDGITALMGELKKRDISGNAQQFIGPSFIASPQSIIKQLAKTPSFVSIIGEFGSRLQTMTAKNAPAAERGILTAMLDLYNKSGRTSTSGSMAYSDAANNVGTVQSPAMSIMGESTPETFYAAIDEQSIASGLVPRFTVIEYRGDRVNENENRIKAADQTELINDMYNFCAVCLAMNSQQQVTDVACDEESRALLKAFSLEADANIRNAANVHREVWNRAHLKVMKLSALIAVGCNMYAPKIERTHVEWAIRVERYNIARMLDKFENGEVGGGNEQSDQEKAVREICKTYMSVAFAQLPKSFRRAINESLHAEMLIPYALLNDVCRPRYCFKTDRAGSTSALQRTLKNMMDAGLIREVRPENQQMRFGSVGKLYAWTDPSSLLDQ